LPEIIRAFKTFSARRINDLQGALGRPIWQRSFYDHVIRKEESMDRIREYIFNNPAQWEYDRENPAGQA
jgi:REP element-mobilizing transposase RayT